ncbi:tetratricopeptide repeat protein [Haloferula sp. A504]|uniref:tetratricopeptide repeat protein n=1 Tax=Haloferula sp. A504 TaxID=3373601 RepID=UPI0031BFC468|nr:tetratricopeptide repeat protein [Verrucomicrobiaceae bacterium E54]
MIAIIVLHSAVSAADVDDLEAKLRDHLTDSPEAAELMLELLSEREANEDVFGVIKTAGDFVRAQAGHPRRAEVMVRLMEGHAAGARHADVVATGKRFLELFADDPSAPRAHRAMAEAFEELGRPAEAAGHWAALGLKGDPLMVKRALDGFDRAENAQAAREGAEFAAAVLGNKPSEPWSISAALKGMELAHRAEQWETGAEMGRSVSAAKGDPALKRQLWFRLGEFESRRGRHQEAAAAMEGALDADDREHWAGFLRELAAAGADASVLAAKAREVAKILPGDPVAHEAAVRAFDAYVGGDQAAKGLAFAEAKMAGGDYSHDLVRRYVEACGDDHGRAEGFLRGQVGKQAGSGAALREVLAVDLYQHRIKDAGKSRAMALEWLSKSPSAQGADRIVACLIDQAADEGEVNADLAAIIESGRRGAHLEGYWQALWRWRSEDPARRKLIDNARRNFERDPVVRLWSRAWKGHQEGARACDELLKQSLSSEQKKWVMRRKAHLHRHELGDKVRQRSHEAFRDYCKAYPKDRKAAEAWLEAAVYGDDAAKLEAARHMLSFAPYAAHPDTRVRVVEVGDAAHRRKAAEWAGKCAELAGSPGWHAARIGRLLADVELEADARRWWSRQYELGPDEHGGVDSLIHLTGTMEEDEAVAKLEEAFQRSDTVHGPIAMALADRAFRAGDLSSFAKWTKATRERQDARPFQDWHVGEWPARGWMEHAVKSSEMPDGDKAKVYAAISKLRIGRISAEAGARLALLEEPSWERITNLQQAIRGADRHHESWTRLYDRALEAIRRRDMTLAAAILNGMLHSVGGVDEKEMEKARARLRTAYASMGSLGSDIPEDSPIAPLLEVVLNLRLGESDKAEQAYFQRRALFDKHVAELPIELLLFAAETHIELGDESDHERAEEMLRGWLVRNGESEQVASRDKARIQLLLARNYLASQRYDVARAEYNTLLQLYPDEAETIDAKFGIGETYLAQGIEDQALEIFEDLAASGDPRVAIRADFMRGLVAIRLDEPDEARRIFLTVLEKVPEIDLADSTLYHLAEVYGIEQRYLAQLETLRTVGRLGRESQRWLTPGKALAVVVQDPDLGISRGEMKLPVRVTTDPGGDVEDSFLLSGGAGRGIFLADIPSVLGVAEPNDGILQVTGGDLIRVDYPAEFKEQFKNQILEGSRIRIATDGRLEVASRTLEEDEEESFTDTLRKEEEETPTLADQRPVNQVKPGNLIHVRVTDGDQDRTEQPDEVAVKLATSSGDVVRVPVRERSAHGGVFVGAIPTGELPAGARASDTAIDHSPLMAIDQRRESSWRSTLDGAAPKSLTVDMKEPRVVESVRLESPREDSEMPIELSLHASHDGRFWYKLAEHPSIEAVPLPRSEMKGMVRRVFEAPKDKLPENVSWADLAKVLEAFEPVEEAVVEELSWQPPVEGDKVHLVVWSGPLVQPRAGALRFSIEGQHTALMFDGRLELPVGQGGRSVDVHAAKGIHELVVVSMVPAGEQAARASRARENRRSANVHLAPFVAEDFDLTTVAGLERVTGPIGGPLVRDGAAWILKQAPLELRHLRWEFTQFNGAGVSVNHMTVAGGGATHIPTEEDVLELAGNETLELAPGDQVTISYLDEIGADGLNRNRLLEGSLTATYGDGRVTPITYSFSRGGSGEVGRQRHELLRIEPGDRIVAEVVDYDLDRSIKRDEVEVEVEAPDGTRTVLTATETGPTTGVFLAEVETSAEAAEGAIQVAPGERVFLRYRDEQNNFPGHAYVRESYVIVNDASAGSMRVIASGALPGQSPAMTPEQVAGDGPVEVSLRLPLTIEVIDPDRALHTGSRIEVDVESSQGTRARIECALSTDHSPGLAIQDDSLNPALQAGRFVGQIPLALGDVESVAVEPADESGGGEAAILNVQGNDTVTAGYADERRPDAEVVSMTSEAVFRTRGSLEVLDEGYEEAVEGVFLGKRLYLQVEDPDLDITPGRDIALVRVRSESGEEETLELSETLSHSGVFNASFPLVAASKPTPGNPEGGVECFFGDTLTVGYLDNVMQRPDGTPVVELQVAVAMGVDGSALAFSKNFRDEDLAIQTQFHVAECHFELFKSHRALEQEEEAMVELEAGRKVLQELREDFPDPKYAPRVFYLLGQFAQELEDWEEAVSAYRTVVRNHPQHSLAPEALYKMGQCHEEAGQLDEALEDYATLAATYPKSPLIANVMLRISEHFYQKEDFPVAASVGRKFLERFPTHEWAPKMAFRVGQALYKNEEFGNAAEAFDEFTKRFPDEELTSQGLFWSGESYRMAGNIPEAFRRYNRCRWDFPESEAAKYSRGRLALPELLSEFDRQADLGD